MQARIRGYLARARHLELLRNSKAVIIQAHVRGWLQRRKYQRNLRRIVLVQSKVRQFLARRTFKKLKIEAKSIEHQKTLNKGLENKIISLQQRLTESERSLSELKKVREEHKLTVRQLEELKASEAKNKGALSRVEVLEQELQQLKAVLEQERAEKGIEYTLKKILFFYPSQYQWTSWCICKALVNVYLSEIYFLLLQSILSMKRNVNRLHSRRCKNSFKRRLAA